MLRGPVIDIRAFGNRGLLGSERGAKSIHGRRQFDYRLHCPIHKTTFRGIVILPEADKRHGAVAVCCGGVLYGQELADSAHMRIRLNTVRHPQFSGRSDMETVLDCNWPKCRAGKEGLILHHNLARGSVAGGTARIDSGQNHRPPSARG